jgi:hypothetical protein
LGLFNNKKREKIEFIEEIIVSVKFPDGVWDIIKEFMIEKPKHKLIKKLNETGIDTLVKILKEQFKRGFSNMKSSSIPLEKRRNLIITTILKCSKPSNIDNILKLYYAEKDKTKIEKDCSWVNNYFVGEQLLCKTGEYGIYSRKAKVIKINKSSLTIGLYSYTQIDDVDGVRNQTYANHRLIWVNFINNKKVIYDKRDLIKQTDFNESDLNIFIEGEKSYDYSN